MPVRKTRRTRKSDKVWQNACLWEKSPSRDSSTVMAGYLNLTSEFILELADKIEAGEIELSEDDRCELAISFRENQNPSSDSSPDYLGNVFIISDDEEEPVRKRRGLRRSKDADDDDEPIRKRRTKRVQEDDDDDEPIARRRKRTSSSSSSTKTRSRRSR